MLNGVESNSGPRTTSVWHTDACHGIQKEISSDVMRHHIVTSPCHHKFLPKDMICGCLETRAGGKCNTGPKCNMNSSWLGSGNTPITLLFHPVYGTSDDTHKLFHQQQHCTWRCICLDVQWWQLQVRKWLEVQWLPYESPPHQHCKAAKKCRHPYLFPTYHQQIRHMKWNAKSLLVPHGLDSSRIYEQSFVCPIIQKICFPPRQLFDIYSGSHCTKMIASNLTVF